MPRKPALRPFERVWQTASAGAAVIAATLLSAAPSLAGDCQSPLAACFDADQLWIPAAPTPFAALPSARTGGGRLTAGATVGNLSRPVVLSAPSPNPDGTEIPVVDDRLAAAVLITSTPIARLQLSLVVPAVLSQSGAGIESVTTRGGAALESTAIGDPRLGAGFVLLETEAGARRPALALMVRYELSLPLGGEQTFAGERSVVAAPSVAAEVSDGAWFAGAEIGARLKQPVQLGDARFGTQLSSALGVGVRPLPDLLSFTAEAFVRPVLVSQPRPEAELDLVPAEWLLAAHSSPIDRLGLSLAVGGAIPLTSATRLVPGGTERQYYAGLATPEWRTFLVARVRVLD